MAIKSAFKCIGLGLVLFPLAGCAVGIGILFASFLRSVAYAPDLEETLFGYTALGLAFIEFLALAAMGLIIIIYTI